MGLSRDYDYIYSSDRRFDSYIKAQEWTHRGQKVVSRHIAAILRSECKGKRIAVLGCDVGSYFQFLKSMLHGCKFLLIDKSRRAIQYVAQKFKSSRTRFYRCNVYDLQNIPEHFDTALCLFFLHHIQDRPRFFAAAYRQLNPGGRMVVLTMTPAQAREHPMGCFFKERPGHDHFPKLSQLEILARKHGFRSELQKEIIHTDIIAKENIPLVFSRYTNSFLFQRSNAEVLRFHRFLMSKAKGATMRLKFRWTLLVLRKQTGGLINASHR